jgi:hypothetical protein
MHQHLPKILVRSTVLSFPWRNTRQGTISLCHCHPTCVPFVWPWTWPTCSTKANSPRMTKMITPPWSCSFLALMMPKVASFTMTHWPNIRIEEEYCWEQKLIAEKDINAASTVKLSTQATMSMSCWTCSRMVIMSIHSSWQISQWLSGAFGSW